MSWQFLGTLGVSMIVAAFLGGGLAVVNVVKIPVVRTRGGFFALVAGGLVITIMGYLTWRDRGMSEPAERQSALVQVVARVMDTIDKLAITGRSSPVVTLVPQSGRKTSPIQVRGTGFQPGERVEVRAHMKVLAKPTTDESGAFGVTVAIPAGTFCPENQCTIVVQGEQSLKWADEPYDIAP